MKKKIILPILAVSLIALSYRLFNQKDYTQPALKLSDNTSISPAVYHKADFEAELKSDFPDVFQRLDTDNVPSYHTIPGLIQTDSIYAKGQKKGRIGVAKDMDPQGFTIMEDYIVISDYSKNKDFNSVLWLVDRKTDQYIKTIVLPDLAHVGGITYDKQFQRLWVTIFDKDKDAAVASIPFEAIRNYDLKTSKAPIAYESIEGLSGIKLASYMTYYQNNLYIGYFDQTKNGLLARYPLDQDGLVDETLEHKDHIKPIKTYPTLPQIQGVAISQDRLVLSQSFGKKNSKLLFFKNPGIENWKDFDQGDAYAQLTIPPYLEQVEFDNEGLYLIFESASAKYRTKQGIVYMDRVIKLDLNKLPSP